MPMGSFIASAVGRVLVDYLTKPISTYVPTSTHSERHLRETIRPADVLLVEGNSRVSTAIKYLTQSTWSHAALYVGPIPGLQTEEGEPHVLVEAELGLGIITSPLSRHAHAHTRLCRPAMITPEHSQGVVDYALGRIGEDYDVKNVIDLARYLLPTPPVPTRFRRRMIALGAGEPTRAICSTLIAQAFQSVHYPILPRTEIFMEDGLDEGEEQLVKEIHHIRHHSLYTPRDFDISPYFNVVKSTIEQGFDYLSFKWAR
jgi:hypothetical protein